MNNPNNPSLTLKWNAPSGPAKYVSDCSPSYKVVIFDSKDQKLFNKTTIVSGK